MVMLTQKNEMANARDGKQGLFVREVKGRDGSRKDIVLVNARGPFDFGFHALGERAPRYLTKHYSSMAIIDAKMRIGNCDSYEMEEFKFRYIGMMADSWQGANEAKKAGGDGFRQWLVEKLESPEVQKLLGEYVAAHGQVAMKRLAGFMIYDFCALGRFDARLALTDSTEVAVISKSFFFDPGQASIRENVSEIAPKISFATQDLDAVRSIAFMLEGTDHLQAKDYHSAFECFDYAIGLWSLNHYAHAKRAACACNLDYELLAGLPDLNIAIAIFKDYENPWRNEGLKSMYHLDRATIFKNLAYKTRKLGYAREALKDCKKSLSLKYSDAGNEMLSELGEVFGLG